MQENISNKKMKKKWMIKDPNDKIIIIYSYLWMF